MENIYVKPNSEYLEKTGTWHAEDSPWKAEQISKMLINNKIKPQRVIEVGCGVGEILYNLQQKDSLSNTKYDGFDIAADAIEIARKRDNKNISFHNEDFTVSQHSDYDVLLMIDVFEHVPDYIGFIEKCKSKAQYKIYHIPLDIHLNSLLRNRMIYCREQVGHLHYFTKETAIATLEDTGQEIVDYFYTDNMVSAPGSPKKLVNRVANLFRKVMYAIAPDFAVKIMGGYSLLVLTK